MVSAMRNPSPGRTGRPRSAAADAAILAATRDALVELGWSKLTMGDVSARAGVAKTTLYRRWAGKNELVVDAVAELFDALELPDRGSLEADIEYVVLQFAELLRRPEARTALMAVVAESTRDEALRDGSGRRSWTGRNVSSYWAASGPKPAGNSPTRRTSRSRAAPRT